LAKIKLKIVFVLFQIRRNQFNRKVKEKITTFSRVKSVFNRFVLFFHFKICLVCAFVVFFWGLLLLSFQIKLQVKERKEIKEKK
jgi:hypothetical protein